MGGCLNAANACAQPSPHSVEKKDNEKTMPFSVNLMRSQVLYQAAQVHSLYRQHFVQLRLAHRLGAHGVIRQHYMVETI